MPEKEANLRQPGLLVLSRRQERDCARGRLRSEGKGKKKKKLGRVNFSIHRLYQVTVLFLGN
jgi:hypothetical protein